MGERPDFVVIGAGIAGASAAYELAPHGRVVLLERESLPGHHTTGRSAAFWVENYGAPTIRALTRGSRDLLVDPPEGFSDHPLTTSNPMLWIGRTDQDASIEGELAKAKQASSALEELTVAQARQLCPVLREDYVARAVCEFGALHIDVAGLLEAFLRGFRRRGGEIVTGAEVLGIGRREQGWRVETPSEVYECAFVINAAGAWADVVADRAGVGRIGLQPKRRTAITFDPPSGANVLAWPCVVDADEDFYFKPEGRVLLASPCDETPMEPHDVTPEDFEIALVADRLQRATTLEIRHIGRSWAGLRNFVADREPVIGIDPAAPGFCWIAGQGGFGIMTAPAAARTVAQLVTSGELPEDIRACGLAPADYSPERLLRSGKTEGDSPMVARA